MRESHTVEEQLAAGLDIKAPTPPPSSSATATIVTTRPLTTGDTSSLSTTMASLVNVANLAAAAVAAKQEPSNSLVTALSMENVVSSNGFLNTMAPTGLPSALDQIRAFAENSALLPESGVNLANALSVMSQEITEGIERTPEKMSSLIKPVESLPRSDQQVTVDTHEEHDSGHAGDDEMEGSGDETDQPARKSKAFKLEQISQRLQGKSPSCSEDGSGIEDKDTDEHHEESSLSPSDPLSQSSVISSVAQPVVTTASQSQAFTSVTSESNLNIFQQAYFAQLNALQDQALYHIHMGYHGYEHVFKCNRCGHIASDYLNFNLHLLQASHE
uniref:C2H2-type domain-containing protein n=1 Tax=Heterorhabditis bacteriophora TaxID=37862 RepID=A0A1I7X6I1_HETBA